MKELFDAWLHRDVFLVTFTRSAAKSNCLRHDAVLCSCTVSARTAVVRLNRAGFSLLDLRCSVLLGSSASIEGYKYDILSNVVPFGIDESLLYSTTFGALGSSL